MTAMPTSRALALVHTAPLISSAAADPALPPARTGDLTPAEAADLTAATVAALGRVEDAARTFAELIKRAWDGRAHRALGHDSWADYCRAAFGPLGELRIPVATRIELVADLHQRALAPGQRKMSARAIADALQHADQTVRADLNRARRAALAAAAAEEDGTVVAGEVVATGQQVPQLTQSQAALVDLRTAGERGLTWRELGRLHRDWRVGPWAVLSRLHAQGRIERLSASLAGPLGGTRDGLAVYTVAEHVGSRAVEAPGRRRDPRPAAQG